jgi:hypothetical protein
MSVVVLAIGFNLCINTSNTLHRHGNIMLPLLWFLLAFERGNTVPVSLLPHYAESAPHQELFTHLFFSINRLEEA